ncbi:unnamed protein product [Adineta ricciae]|uniref:Uncharacterized protein n=1 Tax=Adineta ricciae TaxID=249248 RepID=A0A815PXE2_ADIRI|nr:unnamed protein product [Adineta ricciae]
MFKANVYCLAVALLSLIVSIKCQCQSGNSSQYDQCSQNAQCACLQYSFSSSMYVCGLVSYSCGQFPQCRPPNDACDANEICIRHPRCNSQPVCYPLSMINEQSCPPGTVYQTTEPMQRISNYTSALDSLDGKYTRPNGGAPNTYYEAIQLYVPTSGYYDLTSVSRLDTHGYLYNGTFNPFDPQSNLIAHNDDGAGGGQFKLPVYLQAGIPYTLVVTTHSAGNTGPFSVIAEGPGNIHFSRLNPVTTTTTTTSTTTTSAIIVSAVYNGNLTSSHPFYNRTGGSTGQYYYQAFEIHVSTTGTYTFTSTSNMDTFGYIYQGNFYPFAPQINVHGQDDDSAGSSQFRVTAVLRSDVKYILVYTTYSSNTFGKYSVSAAGPGQFEKFRCTSFLT